MKKTAGNHDDKLIEYHDDTSIKKVRKVIFESWKRCEKYNLDREKGTGKTISPEEMKKRLDYNSELISVARPIMDNLYSVVKGSGFSIILTDNEGCILEFIGDENIMEKSKELNFVKGAIWTEEAVGTNAIGTALYLNKYIQTIGEEHYCIKHHTWTCSAAVIHDEYGNIIGCLNMSGKKSKAHIHTLGIVLTATYSIEKQLALVRSNKLMNATFQSINDGMIILDEDNNIVKVNHKSCEILSYSKEELLNKNIELIIDNKDFIIDIKKNGRAYEDFEFSFNTKKRNKIECTIKSVPVLVKGKTVGIVITFRKSSYINVITNKVAGYKAVYKFNDIVTNNSTMIKLIEHAKKISKTNCNILINGESGTGKELFAQSIHNYSSREKGPFIAVNCASIPRELMESEFFGYEKGAFTGAAKEGRAGKFELADKGTIFLDEIGELPFDMQSKLLRVLDNKKIIRVGGSIEKELDIRIIAATNRDLLEEIRKSNFREDLYYRLNVMNIKLIPLSERSEDIELLTRRFIQKLNNRQGKNKIITPDFIKELKKHSWRGNVRELQNIVERAYYLCDGNIIGDNYLTSKIEKINRNNNKNKDEKIVSLKQVEVDNIINAVKICKGNINEASQMLGMSRATMYRKIKKYGINI